MYIAEMIPALSNCLKEQSDNLPNGIKQIIVFGSHARGTATLRSDIDLALVYANENDEAKSDRAQMHSLLSDILPLTEITLFGTTFNKISNANEPKTANFGIREEGRVIWEAHPTKI